MRDLGLQEKMVAWGTWNGWPYCKGNKVTNATKAETEKSCLNLPVPPGDSTNTGQINGQLSSSEFFFGEMFAPDNCSHPRHGRGHLQGMEMPMILQHGASANIKVLRHTVQWLSAIASALFSNIKNSAKQEGSCGCAKLLRVKTCWMWRMKVFKLFVSALDRHS